MRSLILTILTIVFFLGCSSTLTVQVDIFDSKGLDPGDILESTVQREAAQQAYLLKTDSYTRAKTDIKIQLRNYLDLLAKPEVAVVAADDVARFSIKSDRSVDSAVNDAVQKRNEGYEQTRLAETITQTDERRKAFESALDKFSSATQILTQLRSDFLRPYQGLLDP